MHRCHAPSCSSLRYLPMPIFPEKTSATSLPDALLILRTPCIEILRRTFSGFSGQSPTLLKMFRHYLLVSWLPLFLTCLLCCHAEFVHEMV